MGRGRAKAKQTKVARELKYFTPNTDLDALQRELGAPGQERPQTAAPSVGADDEEYEDPWTDWASDGRR